MTGPITRSDLKRIGEALYGPGWTRKMAEKLNRTKRTVERWTEMKRRPPKRIHRELLDLLDGQIRELEEIGRKIDPEFCRRRTDTLVTRETKTS